MDEEDGAAKGVGERKDARENPPFLLLYFFVLFFPLYHYYYFNPK